MIYFKNILDILHSQQWECKHESIEIAKGKNEIPTTFKQAFNQFKRQVKWQLKK